MSPGNNKIESKHFAENQQSLRERGGIGIRQYDKNKRLVNTYDSVSQASRLTSIGSSCINRCIKGEQYYAGGYIWIKESDAQDPKKLNELLSRKPKEISKPVSQFTLDGRLVGSYGGISGASKKTGLPVSGIGSCARNKCKSYDGYIWIFADKVNTELKQRIDNLSENPQNIPVYKISLSGEILGYYKNASKAAESEGVSASCVRVSATESRPVSKGLIWIYDEPNRSITQEIKRRLEDVKIKEKAKKKNLKRAGKRREIEQYSIKGAFISKFKSAYQAAKETGIGGSSITTCANGERTMSQGFIWIWADDPNKEEVLKERVKLASIPQSRGRKRSVVQCDLKGNIINRFESIKDAHLKTGCNQTGIVYCVNGNGSISGDYLWFDANDNELEQHIKETVEKISSVRNPASNDVPIVQLALDGKLVAEFPSIAVASRSANVCKSCIDDTLHGKQHTAGGYKWEYASDYYKQD